MTPSVPSEDASDAHARAERFLSDLGDLRPERGSRNAWWARLGLGLLVLGPVLALVGLLLSQLSQNALDQATDAALGLAGIAIALLGLGLYLRYSLTQFLRFWLARFIYEQQQGRADDH
jgi:hypothetical membrane protein